MKYRKYTFFIFFFFFLFIYSQKVEVSLQQPWPNNESFDLAKKKGLEEAKVEALRKAGVKESIQSFSRLYTSEDNSGFNEIFESDILTDLSGRITNWNWLSEPEKICKDGSEISYISINIEAKVKKYKTKRDPKFVAKIYPKPKEFYENKEQVKFSIEPYQDCYMKIFYISETASQIVYPLENEDSSINEKNLALLNNQLKKERTKEIYWLSAGRDLKNIEKGRIIIVITKKDIPFEYVSPDDDGYFSKTSNEEIFKWILNIEKEDRKEYYYSFFIK